LYLHGRSVKLRRQSSLAGIANPHPAVFFGVNAIGILKKMDFPWEPRARTAALPLSRLRRASFFSHEFHQ